jgi:uncharacterized protein YndB with AHSA1/START domain
MSANPNISPTAPADAHPADIRLSIDIARPPEVVFDTLADIAHYGRWLSGSITYRETTMEIEDLPIREGTTYIDRNSGGAMQGLVTRYNRPGALGFSEVTEDQTLHIQIELALSVISGGTRLERRSTVTTGGMLRLVRPFVLWMTRRENKRTIEALKAYLETKTPE